MTPSDSFFDNAYADDDPLVQRLRTLEWPSVDAQLRERCWDDFIRKLEDPDAVPSLDPEAIPEVTRRSVARRQSFTRRRPIVAEAAAHRLAGYASARWTWQRRATPRVASLIG